MRTLTCILHDISVDEGSSKGSLSELSTTQDIFVGGFDQILVPSRYGLRACLCGLWVWVLVPIGEVGWLLESLISLSLKLVIIIIIRYIYHMLINTQSACIIIHINLNTTFCTHVEQFYQDNLHKALFLFSYMKTWTFWLVMSSSWTSLLSPDITFVIWDLFPMSFSCYIGIALFLWKMMGHTLRSWKSSTT